MTIDRTHPIFTVCWLVVYGLVVPTVFFSWGQYQQCNSSNDKSNSNEQNAELNCTSLYWGYYSFLYLFYFSTISSINRKTDNT